VKKFVRFKHNVKSFPALNPLQSLKRHFFYLWLFISATSGIIHAVIHLHNLQIMHSDLHSFNIFVNGDSQNQIGNIFRFQNIDVKIADFGKAIDVSKGIDSQKSLKKSQQMERLCLTLITICNLIDFSEDSKKKVVDSVEK
jgi:serine/threonine protein kinase